MFSTEGAPKSANQHLMYHEFLSKSYAGCRDASSPAHHCGNLFGYLPHRLHFGLYHVSRNIVVCCLADNLRQPTHELRPTTAMQFVADDSDPTA
jgi:hypothetical protein